MFDKTILAKKDIMSVIGKREKKAIRVYAPWIKPVVKQVIQTQAWQTPYLFPMDSANEFRKWS
ncbi:MepB family protein [Xanthocytophaga flavus]|uniref:MepB family protein n=1 Tax=Xanthocytophaga TaxID=3078918 RepID=UPI0036F3AD5A